MYFSESNTHFKCSYTTFPTATIYTASVCHIMGEIMSECHYERHVHKHARPLTGHGISISASGIACWHITQYRFQQMLDGITWESNKENVVPLNHGWWSLRFLHCSSFSLFWSQFLSSTVQGPGEGDVNSLEQFNCRYIHLYDSLKHLYLVVTAAYVSSRACLVASWFDPLLFAMFVSKETKKGHRPLMHNLFVINQLLVGLTLDAWFYSSGEWTQLFHITPLPVRLTSVCSPVFSYKL